MVFELHPSKDLFHEKDVLEGDKSATINDICIKFLELVVLTQSLTSQSVKQRSRIN